MCWVGTHLLPSLLGTAVDICKEAITLPARVILAFLSPAEGQKDALDSWIKAFQPEPFTGLFDSSQQTWESYPLFHSHPKCWMKTLPLFFLLFPRLWRVV